MVGHTNSSIIWQAGGLVKNPWFLSKLNNVSPLAFFDLKNNLYAVKSSPLRVATARNQIPYGKSNRAGMDGCLIEFTELVGHDVADLILSFNNRFLDAALGDTNPGNGWTIQDVAIVNASRTISVPVYFGGSRSKAIADGDVNIQSDPISPSSFGLVKFSRNEKYYIKGRITGAVGFYVAAGDNTWGNYGNTGDNVITWWYNTGSTTPSSTDLTTRYTATGTPLTWGYNGPKPFVLGHVISDDASIFAVGDSISSSVYDGATNSNVGLGLFQRAMRDSSNSDIRPSINTSVPSLKLSIWNTSTFAQTFMQYCQSAYVFIGTNDVQSSPTLATMQGRFNTLFTTLRSAGMRKIILHKLLAYTTSTDNWTTEANQTPFSSNWNTGGVVQQINDWFDTLVPSTVDYLLTGSSVLSADRLKWIAYASDSLAAGLHPNAYSHELLSVLLRIVIRQSANNNLQQTKNLTDFLSFTRSSTATYFDNLGIMKTAAVDTPRFDYNPITKSPRGLLVEEQRTNLLLNSETGSNQSITTTATSYTLSFYGTGTVTLSGTYAGALVGSGAYPVRSTLTFTATAGTLNIVTTGTVQYVQIEAGAYPTSYIPTTGTSATRAADQPYIDASKAVKFSDLWNSVSNTIIVEYSQEFQTTGNNARVIEVLASANERSGVVRSTSACQIYRTVGGTTEFAPSLSKSFVSGEVIKQAAVISNNDYRVTASGSSPSQDTTAPLPTTPVIMRIGHANGPTGAISGWISAIKIYPVAVSNDELQRATI